MIDDDVLGVLDVQAGVVALHDVARTETDMADNYIGLADVDVAAGDAYTATRSRLAGDGYIGMLELKFGREHNSTANFEEHGSWCIIARTERPAEGAFHKVGI